MPRSRFTTLGRTIMVNEGACYACVFPPTDLPEETRCATMGVFAPLVGIVGTMQAAMALQVINGSATELSGKLMLLDGASLSFTDMRVDRNPHCPVCAQR